MKILFFLLFWMIFSSFTESHKLHTDEVLAIKGILEKLALPAWDFDKDPCNDAVLGGILLFCDCSFESNTTCRAIRMYLPSRDMQNQSIRIAIPSDFAQLYYLQVLDLSHNYLSGAIPSEWATMHLTKLDLTGNMLSGPFPRLLTRMTTLQELKIEGNRFSGPIPKDIDNLKSLETLILSSNDFTGRLPLSLAKLTNLTNLRISDNNFTGKIPSFISQWTQIKSLYIQGCCFEGPFPSGISQLTELEELVISDLKGGGSTFPSLKKTSNLNKLVLRNCLIYGTIPNYFRDMKLLDLSFNNLTGDIPASFSQLEIQYIFLTGNKLTGRVPGWVLSSTKNVDISCNNFTWDASGPKKCQQDIINVIESFSSSTNSSSSNKLNNINTCLRKDFPCTKPYAQQIHSLHINCGGDELLLNDTIKFQGDAERVGASSSYINDIGGWAFSNTGTFLKDDGFESDDYILSNQSTLQNLSPYDTELYTKARTAAVSLTYYGLCLMNGNYTVNLHFAEIFFTQDHASNILVKRVFDVLVQGELKLKDFDIVKEAGGTGRAVIKSFTATVKDNTLKIQLYWAGKGTTYTGYGPIISAISVESQFEPPNFGKKSKVGLIVGTVVGATAVTIIILISLGWWYIKRTRIAGSADLQAGMFRHDVIKAATNNFDSSNELGAGGFGTVYKGQLPDGTLIVVKQISIHSKQGFAEFINEIGLITVLRHPNLVRLYGFCNEEMMCLIYEYMENNSLSRALYGINSSTLKAKLTWPVRLKICIGIAKGLIFIHDGSHKDIIHRDIKTSNVLLDEKFNAKISDFGLAKLYDQDENTGKKTKFAGTMGYAAPEYAIQGFLSKQTDVYGFGIVVLEIVSGKSISYLHNEESGRLLEWAWQLRDDECLVELVDSDLTNSESTQNAALICTEALTVLNVALLCTEASPVRRPTISEALEMLEGRRSIEAFTKNKGFSIVDHKNHVIRDTHYFRRQSERRPMTSEPHTESFVTTELS